MNNKQFNYTIRQDILAYLQRVHKANSRLVIKMFGKKWHTSKQRVAGNLRALTYDFKSIQIQTIMPNKKSYIYPL
jgi:hypothetical protein